MQASSIASPRYWLIAVLASCLASLVGCRSVDEGPSKRSPSETISTADTQYDSGFTPPPYDRDTDFGRDWADPDSDCLNTRMEVLQKRSLSQVTYDASGCRILSGRWFSEYTLQTISDASMIQIDHVVPLAVAWNQGAYRWTQETRTKFANDPDLPLRFSSRWS